jgi:hypothetical protein
MESKSSLDAAINVDSGTDQCSGRTSKLRSVKIQGTRAAVAAACRVKTAGRCDHPRREGGVPVSKLMDATFEVRRFGVNEKPCAIFGKILLRVNDWVARHAVVMFA